MLAIASLVLALGGDPPEIPPSVPAADYRLEWEAPPGCPDAATIERRVAALTAGRPPGEGTLAVHGRVVVGDGLHTLTLRTTLRGHTGIRQLSSTLCGELAETVALVVAVSLDPSLSVATPPASTPAPAPSPEPRDGPVPDAPVPDPAPLDPAIEPVEPPPPSPARAGAPPLEDREAPPPEDRERPVAPPRLLLRGGLGPELGALPGPTAALRLTVGLRWPRAQLLLAATYLTPRRAEGPGTSAALYQQGMVALLGCGRWSRGAWSVPVCGGLEAGGLRADGRRLQRPRAVVGPWLGPMASVGLTYALRRLGLWLDLEGVARGIATRVVVDDALAFRPSVGSWRTIAGIEFSWR